MTIYKVSDPILGDATEYAKEYGLTLGDAIHLATAARARGHGLDQPIVLLVSDRRLKNVGMEVGFSILDPEDPDTQTKLRSLRGSL
jgi:predicted nucleic acid-binding protein